MISYGFVISWSDFDGSRHSISVDQCGNPAKAFARALSHAIKMGWTPPKWYQWWRWGETRLDYVVWVSRLANEIIRTKQENCCYIDNITKQLCNEEADYWVGTDGVDQYTHVCANHVHSVTGARDLVLNMSDEVKE